MLIELPTRRRPDWLFSTLVQLPQMLIGRDAGHELLVVASPQSISPQCQLLMEFLHQNWATISVCEVDDETSLPNKHQVAYEMALKNGHDEVMILHDDFYFPYKGFFRWLRNCLRMGYGAVGGVDPGISMGLDALRRLPDDYLKRPELCGKIEYANNWHQVFYYPDSDRTPVADHVEHLFGPFMYYTKALEALGGFPVDRYSRASHREETDVTYRIFQAGWGLGSPRKQSHCTL